jgi:hypothetical protein
MDYQKLEQLASSLNEFRESFKSRLTSAESQAIAKLVIVFDLIMYDMLKEKPSQPLDGVVVLDGRQSPEVQEFRKCINCQECICERSRKYCFMLNRLIEPFHNGCEMWKEKRMTNPQLRVVL